MANKAVFLDRDDTLIEDPGYINDPSQVRLLDGIPESLAELKRMGYMLIVVSNQSGVARGIVSEKVLAQIHERLEQLLAQEGARLDKIYYCPYHPDGAIPQYRKESDWRKPSPGMFLAAAKEMNIDLAESWAVGNGLRDIQAGRNAGCKTILICDPAHTRNAEATGPRPDYEAVNMREVVNIIKKYGRSSKPLKTEQTNTIAAVTETVTRPEAPFSTDQPRQEPGLTQTPPQDRSNELLREILEQLRKMQRTEMFGEFSLTRLIAGIVQMGVLVCLVISIWFLMGPQSQTDSVLICLGFAVVFQVMALTFFIMQGPR